MWAVLKTIGKEHDVNVTHKMTKAELVQALQQQDIILDNLGGTELKFLAKVRGIAGYCKMHHAELVEAL